MKMSKNSTFKYHSPPTAPRESLCSTWLFCVFVYFKCLLSINIVQLSRLFTDNAIPLPELIHTCTPNLIAFSMLKVYLKCLLSINSIQLDQLQRYIYCTSSLMYIN